MLVLVDTSACMQARVDFGILNEIENPKLSGTLSNQLDTNSADVDDDAFMTYLLNFTPLKCFLHVS